jgi:hypothetical protein
MMSPLQKSTGLMLLMKQSLFIVVWAVRTSQETHDFSATEPSRANAVNETIAVYCENHTEHSDIICGQDAGFYYILETVTYSDHIALKCEVIFDAGYVL